MVVGGNGKGDGGKDGGRGGKGEDEEEGEGLRRRGSKREEEEEEEEEDEKLISRQVDDIRLTFALLHSNVDKFIANKIMTVYAGKVDFDKTDSRAEKQREEEEKRRKRCKTGLMKRAFRWMRPTLPKSRWERF